MVLGCFLDSMLETTSTEYLLSCPKPQKGLQRCLGDVRGVLGPQGFRQNVTDPSRLDHSPNRLATDQARSGACRSQEHLRPAELRIHLVRNGVGSKAHRLQRGLRILTTLSDGVSHLPALAQAQSNPSLLVARDYQRTETEAPAAFDDLRGAIDEDDLLDQAIVPTISILVRGATPAAALPTVMAIIAHKTGHTWGGQRRGHSRRSLDVLDFFRHNLPSVQNLSPPSRAASANAFTLP